MKKVLFFLIPFMIVVIAIGISIFGQTDFHIYKAKRESVVDMIADGSIEVMPSGCIILPDNLKKLSDSGECYLVEFENTSAIYFYSFRGLLESSKGYLFITDKISYSDYIDTANYAASRDFVNLVELEPNWYSCSTD